MRLHAPWSKNLKCFHCFLLILGKKTQLCTFALSQTCDLCRFAGIGGVSELLGWTEVQQEYSQGFMGGSETVLKVRVCACVCSIYCSWCLGGVLPTG